MAEGGLHTLLAQAGSGDDQARERAFAELLRLLTIFVRAGMGQHLRDHRESEDVCQSIARSFLEDFADGKVRFDGEGQVVAYLKTVVRTKLALLARHDGAGKRGGGIDRVALAGDPGSAGADGVPAAGPGDGELAAREREALGMLYAHLTAEEQELARLRLAGLEWAQIAARVGRDQGVLRKQWSRLVARVADHLEK